MEKYEKQVNDKRKLVYTVDKEGLSCMSTISEMFLDENNRMKLDLSRWDDYGFDVWLENEDKVNKVSFEYDIDHPLFFPLMHLINYDEEILIDDDDTYEYNKKYMLIHRVDNKVNIDFVNNLNKPFEFRKFSVFIKNIAEDGRSKLTDNPIDVKTRLWLFYKEVSKIMTNEPDNQITIEEYYLRNTTNPRYDILKDFYYRQTYEKLQEEYTPTKGYVYRKRFLELTNELYNEQVD